MLTVTGSVPVMDAHPDTRFMLGEIKVSPSHNTLWARDQSIKVQPKVMAVLHYLALNQNRVISNEELIERLWAGRVVTHGSVQKSINALRTALNGLISDQEFIVHYSKRGYQLAIEPQFLTEETLESPNVTTAIELGKAFASVQPKWRTAFWTITVLIVLFIIYHGVNWATIYLPNHHNTVFQTTAGYTNETGHERNPTPHPDNQHIAYIREKANPAKPNESDSEIVIRNAAGKDWRVATSHGTWFKLAWSPAGKNLVAIEIKRRDKFLAETQFYQPPNFLYSFHIFALDLDKEQLLEKQQLSQWQGQILSVTWWDEDTLEIVAKQGPNAGNGRYRYSIREQQLKLLDEVEGAINPIASTILNQKTAIASLHKNKVRIDFLNAAQGSINRVQLDVSAADISWIPDGSGVLVYAEEERKLFVVYLNGKQVAIPLAETKDKIFSRPHYSTDGTGIYYTEEKRSANIVMASLNGLKTSLTGNINLNYAASFSPSGERIVYASVRNNQTHLWLVENGQEHQLTTQPVTAKIDSIIWSDDGDHIVFNSGNQLYHHNLLTNTSELLVVDTDNIEPIAYYPNNNRLFALKHNGDSRNLWRIEGKQQKQLTFGAVGSAIEYSGDVLFQYVSESGLWALRSKDDSLERIPPNVDAYSKLLKADSAGIYFITGGTCHESNVFYWRYTENNKSIFLPQPNNAVSTTSFNPNKGLLQTGCELSEANIVLLK
ncbi:winged helix-turn-helix domain-containing protein [Cellvibrio mixtus]|uniref:winged helix-turn-helix domain-containing protein n=1 Tax=Cellvibrio mixtus TaxID=39650 RepID=UPI000586689D|nr:winged helix-turn-helix domain-containing protein [Cellvibrio mixtus]